MKRTLAAWTIGLTVAMSAYSGAAAAAHIDITNMGDMGGYPFVLGADGVPSSSMGARRASAASSTRAATDRAATARQPGAGESNDLGHTHLRGDEAGTVGHSEFNHGGRRPAR